MTVTEMTLTGLVELLESLGGVPGENGMSELDHGLQCAYELSLARPDDEALQIAGLVHDVGHQLASDEQHGRIGAECVRPLLGDRVAGMVEAHVPAKRYLVSTDVAYGEILTSGSVVSLARQGGPLTAEEVAEFESGPYAADAVVLRKADDAAKVPGRVVPQLAAWLPALHRVAGAE
jgi:predicted HD phosphohydrolase